MNDHKIVNKVLINNSEWLIPINKIIAKIANYSQVRDCDWSWALGA